MDISVTERIGSQEQSGFLQAKAASFAGLASQAPCSPSRKRMNTKILAVVVGIVVLSSVLGVIFVTGIFRPPTTGKSNSVPTMSGYVFSNNTELTMSITSAQTGTITKAQVCDSSNSCYSEAITFSYPGKIYLNLNSMVGATFAFQYYTNYTIILTDSSGNHSFQAHYTDPYGPWMTSVSFSNNTALTVYLVGNGTYTQCGHDGGCGSGTIVKTQICYNSSCYSETRTHSYPGVLSLNLNNMSLSGSPFVFTSGYSYKIILTDPDGASYSWQLTR